MASYVRDDLAEGTRPALSFHRCGHCGCLTHWWGIGDFAGPDHMMGINTRLLPKEDVEGVERAAWLPGPPANVSEWAGRNGNT